MGLPAHHISPPSGLFDLLAPLSSPCNLLPSLLGKYQAYIAGASPRVAFVLANLILLALLLTSNKPNPARSCTRPPISRSPKSKSTKVRLHRRRILNDREEEPWGWRAHKHSRNGALRLPRESREEIQFPSAMHSTGAIQCFSKGPAERGEGLPECEDHGGLQAVGAPPNPNQTLVSSLGHEGGSSQEAPTAEDASNHDLDRKFDEYINAFFDRVRAEIRESG